MTKLLLLALCSLFALADRIELAHAQIKPLGKIITTNAKITQLSNQKQQIVSILGGHIENYFVEPGAEVKKGDRVVLIQSMELSKMTAEYIALSRQIEAARYDLDTAEKLFQKGVGSKQEKNAKLIALQEIKSKRNTLRSQLKALGIDPDKLKEATDELLLIAHADGIVGELLVPLHSTVDAQTPLITLVQQSGYYALAYLSVDDAMKVTPESKGQITLAGERYPCRFVQLLPEVDSETQRAQLLFWIEKDPKNLLLGAFAEMAIVLPPYHKAVMVRQSALSLFNGEWVVFTPQEAEHHEAESPERHAEEEHHKEGAEIEKAGHEEHGGEHEEHDAVPYAPQVVEIIAYSGDDVAVEGIDANETYVSEGVYFVKSMILKSSLGEHGH
jgi:multidrug efflux pump subunit AcrA (membrane-fusion protein)